MSLNILLVCTGNTCRSPMAEAIGRDLLKEHKDVWVSSAGVASADGLPASFEAVEAMSKLGLDLSAHRSRGVTRVMAEQADAIYTMTESHRRELAARFPEFADRIQRLDPQRDVADPIGGDLAVYEKAAVQIRGSLEKRVSGLGIHV